MAATTRWRLNLCGLEPQLIKLEFIIYLAKLKVINHPKVFCQVDLLLLELMLLDFILFSQITLLHLFVI